MAGAAHLILETPQMDKPTKLLIVVSPYYKDVADALVSGARKMIEQAGATHELIEVPGALEIPTAIATAFRMSTFDGFVALGCVIRGETTHYDTVCADSSHGLTLLGLQGALLGNGILTVENHDQAIVRADPVGQNKGGGAAAAALHLIALARRWGSETKNIGFKPMSDATVTAESDRV